MPDIKAAMKAIDEAYICRGYAYNHPELVAGYLQAMALEEIDKTLVEALTMINAKFNF